jgi:hypothetical protein
MSTKDKWKIWSRFLTIHLKIPVDSQVYKEVIRACKNLDPSLVDNVRAFEREIRYCKADENQHSAKGYWVEKIPKAYYKDCIVPETNRVASEKFEALL